MGEDRVVTDRVYHVPAYGRQITIKGAWCLCHSHVTHFQLWAHNDISGTVEARVVKFYTQVNHLSLQKTNHPKTGRGQGHVRPIFSFDAHIHLRNGWSETCQIVCAGRIYQVLALRWQNIPQLAWSGWSGSRDPFFSKFAPNRIFGIGEAMHFKFRLIDWLIDWSIDCLSVVDISDRRLSQWAQWGRAKSLGWVVSRRYLITRPLTSRSALCRLSWWFDPIVAILPLEYDSHCPVLPQLTFFDQVFRKLGPPSQVILRQSHDLFKKHLQQS